MIEYVEPEAFCIGDIFEADVEALVNPVNCVGVSGRGLAKDFKERFPENFLMYKSACDRGILRPGKLYSCHFESAGRPLWIINFPTKDHWRDASHVSYIRDGLKELVAAIAGFKIHSIAIPALGCGLGALSWKSEVRPLLEAAFADLPGVLAKLYYPH